MFLRIVVTMRYIFTTWTGDPRFSRSCFQRGARNIFYVAQQRLIRHFLRGECRGWVLEQDRAGHMNRKTELYLMDRQNIPLMLIFLQLFFAFLGI